MSDRLAELERLQRLREQGALDEAEFTAEKARLLADDAPPMSTSWRGFRTNWPLIAGGGAAIGLCAGLVWLMLPGPLTPNGPVPAARRSAHVTPTPAASPTLLPVEALAAAQAVAFPKGLADGATHYEPGTLVNAPFGPVLVNEGRVADASHADSGSVAVHYLAATGTAFRVTRAFPAAVRSGSFGQMSEMAVSRRFSDLPVIYAEGGGTWQGYTCGWTTLTELRADGPVELVTFMDAYDDTGAVEDGGTATNGKIGDIVPGRSFRVHFTGSRTFDASYVRKGDKYTLQGDGSAALTGC